MLKDFINTTDWEELKQILKDEFELKPIAIKTENMSAEQIAIEVRASQLAQDKMNLFIRRLQAKLKREAKQSWK